MPLDPKALGAALDEELTTHTTLCRRDAPAFQRASRSGDELVVACTQESRLFTELSQQTEGAVPLDVRPIRFVNIRETGGWGREAKAATPKMAALLAAARLPDPEPVPTVTYRSEGRLLIVGPLDEAERFAERVADVLDVTLFAQGGRGQQARNWPVLGGQFGAIKGWLGAFEAEWSASNPIDLDLCTRCNACVAACPEGAIGLDYQIDLDRCRDHRACVKACEAVGAINFQRDAVAQSERFDLVLDLRDTPAFTQHAHPQGYFHLPGGLRHDKGVETLIRLRDMVGEFEKPKFFTYNHKLCAHGRNETVGCDACITVCSALAIRSEVERQQIAVNPNLCVGCGACTTVCPTGALAYATPRASEQGAKLRTVLSTYAKAGGKDAALLLHSQTAGTELIDALGREAMLRPKAIKGVPARVIPLPLWHTASAGLDLWLSAFAYGASQVWVLMTDEEAPQYRDALREQMAVAQAIVSGLGYSGTHFRLIEARDVAKLDVQLASPPAQGVQRRASYAVQREKRATMELALDHLLQDSAAHPRAVEAVALPAASLFGTVTVNKDACTLCLSCVSACPANALLDNAERPQLRFVEKNCVQCGLCVTTCPEDAITLQPRLLLTEQRRQPRVLNEAKPYACVRCGKPFGTLKGVELMLGKLAGHSMFQGEALERLKMCGDCRVVDIYTNPNETRITDH
ncbi:MULTISPECIES: 4Fe-4S binding protein [Hydrogenophaga]|uniref:4Fe-4S ferredoxin, iron-sulfur binding domain protein n=1 Tax=Hydrogenophaga intermedia TaxID=65786 RepID=A0A1L1PR31_HYDIT|nr:MULTISPECIES: 4Fe-4S binding protein [Hydrogenophaga]AOS80429.1 4Fe-4S ferredoxin [Hydrogenophaga sp. PBC]TMU78085.1 4Fe-4S dicluster domain-containing protein [Hydrogenophaga intermedia]CDN88516.1 4Fe-4S ferredoxin, iron-sulfur binding domain protein [Hydrogenophaga intermedia]